VDISTDPLPSNAELGHHGALAVGIWQATSSDLLDALAGVWDYAGCGSKFNLLDTIFYRLLAF
jgi:hypothetical protein